MLIPVELTENKYLQKKYIPLNRFLYTSPEFLLIGFEINSRYDEERFLIDESLCPVRIHHENKDENKDAYFYGVVVDGNETYLNTLEEIKLLSHTPTGNEYFNANVVKITGNKKLYDKNIDINLFFCNNDIPFYQRFSEVKTYIFFNLNQHECN